VPAARLRKTDLDLLSSIESSAEEGVLANPVETLLQDALNSGALKEDSEKTKEVIREALNRLERHGRICIEHNDPHDPSRIARIKIFDTTAARDETAERVANNGAPVPSAPMPVALAKNSFAQKPPPEKPIAPGHFLMLIDGSNAVLSARDADFGISWERLKKLLRAYGKIMGGKPLIFFSERDRMREVRGAAHRAGFLCVICPMSTKDRDSVDTAIIDYATNFIVDPDIPKFGVLVVSRDRDLHRIREMGENHDRVVITVNVLEHQSDIEGEEVPFELEGSKHIEAFNRALSFFEAGRGLDPEAEEYLQLLTAVIHILKERDDQAELSFTPLLQYVRINLPDELQKRYGRILQAALTVLVDAGLLLKNRERTIVTYSLDRTHPLFSRLLSRANV